MQGLRKPQTIFFYRLNMHYTSSWDCISTQHFSLLEMPGIMFDFILVKLPHNILNSSFHSYFLSTIKYNKNLHKKFALKCMQKQRTFRSDTWVIKAYTKYQLKNSVENFTPPGFIGHYMKGWLLKYLPSTLFIPTFNIQTKHVNIDSLNGAIPYPKMQGYWELFNVSIVFNAPLNIGAGYLLWLPHRGDSNKYPQHMVYE